MHWTRITRILPFAMAAALLASLATGAAAQKKAAEDPNWWKNAVFYEIYPRSFQDSNGDGIGDLNGITARLGYLEKLGVDAIWLTPVYPSPQVDFGYDISDYENIDPQYGTLADFDHLVAEANKHHIRILMDMVMNHTSDKHKWFLESRSSKTNPYRDWYVWHDGKGETATDPGTPPNNWQSVFGHTAWQWDPTTRQYWYHKFYVEQPDLNWDNPKVHQAFKDVISFWLKRGVAGFRFDAITTLFEDPNLADEGVLVDKDGKPRKNELGDPVLDNSKTDNLPGVHPVMQEMRAHLDSFNGPNFPGTRVMIGETYLPNIGELAKQYGPAAHPEFHLPMDTQILLINKMDAAAFRQKISEVQTQINGNTPLLVFDNHDNPRLDARYCDGVHNVAIQRAIATVLLATRGASLFYYGDELGMVTTPPTRKEDVKDPVGLLGWPVYKGRDGERTPMQWDDSANAGFAKKDVTPWLPVPASYTTANVASEVRDSSSLFTWYQSLIHLKKTNPALANGENLMIDTQNPKALSWLRKPANGPSVLVSINFTAEPVTVNLSEAKGTPHTLLKSPDVSDPASLEAVQLPAFGVYVAELR